MSDIKTLGPPQGPDDGIEDAEFEEINEPQSSGNGRSSAPETPTERISAFERWMLDTPPGTLLLAAVLTSLTIFLLFALAARLGIVPVSMQQTAEPAAVMETAAADTNAGQQAAAPDRYLIQQPVARSSFDPTSLRKGTLYSKLRQTLIANGFEPAQYDQRDCSPYGTGPGEECFDRPEISGCSGTGRGFCVGYWLKGDNALSVLVAEGPDGVFEDASSITRADVLDVIAQDGKQLVN